MATITQRSSKAGASRRPWNAHRLATKLALVLTLLCASSGLAAVTDAAASTATHISATQPLAALLYTHRAYQSPRTTAPVLASLPARTPITGEQTTLPVIGEVNGRGGTRWLKVMLPGRPNSSSGWIARGGTRQLLTSWHIVANLSRRRVWVYLHGRVVRTFPVVVGAPSTPTPTGNFFVEESVIMPASEPGGPFALALSARSDVFQEFDGGPGQIGIHGRDGLGGTLGTAASHGCIRLATADIDWLAARIGPGVPVNIYG
jgi:lipoprotein-anchoring transpeptidase ErfK/SrfK